MPQDPATIAMTYAELAKRLSIKPESAKRMAQRRKWHRVIGNDGIALVHVPASVARRNVPDDVTHDVAPDASPLVIAPVTPDLAPRVAHLEGLLEGMREQIEAERGRADAEKGRADAAEARITDIAADRDAWRGQAQRSQRSLWSRMFGSGN